MKRCVFLCLVFLVVVIMRAVAQPHISMAFELEDEWGFDGVYEFSKDFRNEGMDRFHNPEFTQMELYVAYKDYEWMMNLVEEMVEAVAIALHGTTQVQVGENLIDFKRPWKRYTMFEAIEHFTGTDVSNMDEAQLAGKVLLT